MFGLSSAIDPILIFYIFLIRYKIYNFGDKYKCSQCNFE